MASPSDCSVGARICFAILGIVLGVFACVSFAVQYNNVHASVWGLISGMVASLTLTVHVMALRGEGKSSATALRLITLSGAFLVLLGLCATAFYVTLAIQLHQGVKVIGDGYIVTSMWCLLTSQWGFQLHHFSSAAREGLAKGHQGHLVLMPI